MDVAEWSLELRRLEDGSQMWQARLAGLIDLVERQTPVTGEPLAVECQLLANLLRAQNQIANGLTSAAILIRRRIEEL